MLKMEIRYSFCCMTVAVILLLLHAGGARDLRTVTEPKTPQSCTTLKAGSGDQTQAIQKALNSCAKSKAVQLSSGTFLSGPLTIPSGVSLLVDSGATLKAIPNPSLYDLGKKTCGTLDKEGVGCKPFITIHGATGSGIYGKGTIDGQGGEMMTGKSESWWKLATSAKNKNEFQNNPRLIQVNDSADITLYQITLKNSPFYHVSTSNINGLTVWGITIDTPSTARNTDGVDPMGSQNVTIAHCTISTGDDNVAIKAMISPSRHISVLNNHFGSGHGMSIGSEITYGASDVTVSGLTLDGTTNGLRIKSNTFRGGVVTRVSYTNVCMLDVKHPIMVDMEYGKVTGSLTPEFHNISFTNVKVLTKGTFTFDGLSDSKPVEATLKDVHIKKGSKWITNHAKITGSWEEDAAGTACGNAGNS
ncbi:endo-polygalacturonase-like [Bacillus rossius redtenbacheri]|uniref:endo-polygalacturonase-like n=1 Tax=Bacillus rossius redtenbacheri TaxID=93214 RepID=UPI002FDD14A1